MTADGRPEPVAQVAGLLQLLRRASAEIECVVQGGSMDDAIPDGARVRIRMDGAINAPSGTAVALLLGGDTFSVHRLVRRGRSSRAREYVVTHGDGNLYCDAPQRVRDLLGVVVAVRGAADPAWRPVPPPTKHPLWRRGLTAGVQHVITIALEGSPALAMAFKNALVLALKPLVWARPYGEGRVRSASRLIVAGPPPAE